jgi:xanthine dehydrogenase small subunit
LNPPNLQPPNLNIPSRPADVHQKEVQFLLNGAFKTLSGEWVFRPISDWLRYDQGLTGTKVVCAEGDCGACTLLVGRFQPSLNQTRFLPVNGCIQYGYQVDGTHLVTIEGLSPDTHHLTPFQEEMVTHHGAQCGYCTPGFIMAMTGYAMNQPRSLCSIDQSQNATGITCSRIKEALTGNLCRCTGYEPILKASMALAFSTFQPVAEQFDTPEHRASLQRIMQGNTQVSYQERTVFIPNNLADAMAFLAENPDVKIVSGGTDTSVVCNKRGLAPQTILSLGRVQGLDTLTLDSNSMVIGSRVLLSDVETALKERLPQFADILEVYGSPQIKNAGTISGNIANGSPIGDSLPFLMAMGAEVEVVSQGEGSRRIPFDALYTGYRTLSLNSTELITAVHCPLPKENQRLMLYKVSKRKHLDISTVASAFLFDLDATDTITSARIAYGGVAATVIRLPEVETFFVGKSWTLETFEQAGELAMSLVKPLSDVRGTARFRRLLVKNLLVKAFYEYRPVKELILAGGAS